MRLGAIYLQEQCIVPRVWDAVSTWEKTRGLLGRPALQFGEGMLIRDCRMVHTLGMGYALDLAFLDKHGCIKKLVSQLSPCRMSGSLHASQTLELAPDTLARIALKVGDVLSWRETKL